MLLENVLMVLILMGQLYDDMMQDVQILRESRSDSDGCRHPGGTI